MLKDEVYRMDNISFLEEDLSHRSLPSLQFRVCRTGSAGFPSEVHEIRNLAKKSCFLNGQFSMRTNNDIFMYFVLAQTLDDSSVFHQELRFHGREGQTWFQVPCILAGPIGKLNRRQHDVLHRSSNGSETVSITLLIGGFISC